jgi:uncharacterized protein YegJ (DUF2314 family)
MSSTSTARLVCAALLSSIAVAACGAKNDTPATPKSPSPVVYTRSSDAAMASAIARARAELPSFIAVMKAPTPAQSAFGVKVAMLHPGGVEHIWLGQPAFEGDNVVGIVEDVPEHLANVSRGSRVRVSTKSISDWMYMENGRLVGGYTMRVAIDRLPENERADQKKSFGLE